MKRESPAEARKSKTIVDAFVKGGIAFIPMPVLNEDDRNYLVSEVDRRLEILEKEADN